MWLKGGSFFFSSRRRHTRCGRDWSSDVCSSDLGVPVPDPMAADAGARLEIALGRGKAHAIGEVHLRQVSRKIDRDPTTPAFDQVLEVAAKHALPVVVHNELNDKAAD